MWKKEKVFARKKGTVLQEDTGRMVCHFLCAGEEKWTPEVLKTQQVGREEDLLRKRLRTGQG